MNTKINEITIELAKLIDSLPLGDKVIALNEARKALHEISPFKDNPVDYIEWVKADVVHANDYNPNSVAPPEMELLYTSIKEDGYTQPIVSHRIEEGYREVVDGFHRNRVGREKEDIKGALNGYLPIVSIRQSKSGRANRMASTVRHNRARGTHAIRSMSDMVLEFTKMGWSDKKIGKHLGMEAEEVFRLKQITGLKEAFSNHEFSKSWIEFETKFED